MMTSSIKLNDYDEIKSNWIAMLILNIKLMVIMKFNHFLACNVPNILKSKFDLNKN